jgi:hypothetical protein
MKSSGFSLFTLSLLMLVIAACQTGIDPRHSAGLTFDDPMPYGPQVVFDPLAKPVPEVPIPNDLLLRPKGQQTLWNVSTHAPTKLERQLREHFNTLDGFGPFAPIMVTFDGPIALETVTDDSVLVVNIEEGHPREGHITMMDLGRGYYPNRMTSVRAYWGHDPKKDVPDFLLGADNKYDLNGDGTSRRVPHYEMETNTLILRPAVPLDQGAQHAVLITRDVLGHTAENDGNSGLAPVRSPFLYKAHAAQTEDVARALTLIGRDTSDLAFGWTFTTGRMEKELVALREGLHGRGVLAHLSQEFPPVFSEIRPNEDQNELALLTGDDSLAQDPTDHGQILQVEILGQIMDFISSVQPVLSGGLQNVDYVVFGSFESPGIRTSDRLMSIDTQTGAGEVDRATVPFMISIPKTTAKHKPPFPVVLYFHGTNTSRLEMLAIMDAFARQGVAGFSFDEVGHGPIIPHLPLLLQEQGIEPSLVELAIPVLVELLAPHRVDEFSLLTSDEAVEHAKTIPLFAEFAAIGRAEDLNGDGIAVSGESFFAANPFKQCAAFHQDVVDFMQAVRILRNFDPANVPPALPNPRKASTESLQAHLMAGDFNGDGILDIGGKDVHIGTAGTSLGGFHSIVAAAVEKEVSVVSPIVAGGGIMDVVFRSKLRMVTEGIYHETFGPFIVGCPDENGGVHLTFNNDADMCKPGPTQRHSFAYISGVRPDMNVTLRNLVNGVELSATVNPEGGFSVGIEADRWDQLQIIIETDAGNRSVWVQTPYEGAGLERNSPDFRRFWVLSQHVLDRCDPMSFAPRLFLDPLPGHEPVNVLMENALGDDTVPISTGISLARAAGLLGRTREEWEPIMAKLIAAGTVRGKSDYDVDDALGDNPTDQPPIGPLKRIPNGNGFSAIRFADVNGNHEWIAAVKPGADLDHAIYSQSRIALFQASNGAILTDDLCIAKIESQCLEDPSLLAN